MVRISDIIYVEVNRQYLSIITTENVFITVATLKKLQRYLPKNRFCKVHRAFIVAIDAIKAFDSKKVYLKGKEIPMGYTCREELIGTVNVLTNEAVVRSPKVRTVRQIQQQKKISS